MKLSAQEIRAIAEEFLHRASFVKLREEELQRRWDAVLPKLRELVESKEWQYLEPLVGDGLESLRKRIQASNTYIPEGYNLSFMAASMAKLHGLPLYENLPPKAPSYDAVERGIILSALGAKTVDDIMQMLEKKFS